MVINDSLDVEYIMTITKNQLNHFVLQKQHLTDDFKTDDIVQIVRDIGGLHATGSTTPYLSLFSRMRNFTREKLDKELYVKKTLGKIRCVRKTVYVIPKERIPIAFNATKKLVASISEPHLYKYLGVTQKEYGTTSKAIMEILKSRGMTAKVIKEELGASTNISGIVNLMCDQGLLIRGKPQKGWKSNIHTYYLFHDFFPNMDLNLVDEIEARESIVKQYLASFGPATENDVAWWTGFPKGQIRQILECLKKDVTQVEITELKDYYIMLSSDEKLLKSMKIPKKSVINLLPNLDPYLMGYKDRLRYLNQEYYNYVFDRSGNATNTILIDGRIIGVWDFIEPFVNLFLFGNIESGILGEIHSEAKNIGAFISGKQVTVEECDSMIPLIQRTAGGFMSPLKYS